MPYFKDNKTDEEKLSEEIRQNNLSGVYIIYGNDSYLKRYYCDKLIALSYSGDPVFNFQKFGYDAVIQDVYDAVNQFPMMADSKCVLLEDYDIFTCAKEDLDRLCKLAGEVEDGCRLIIKFDCVDFDQKKNSKVIKLTKSVEKAGGKVYNITHRSRSQLTRMLIKSAKNRNLILFETEASFLIERVGDDLSTLRNELDKLCYYRKSGKITREDIRDVCIIDMNASVFEYVGFITEGNVTNALKLLDKMFFMKTDEYSIFYQICTVYYDMYRALAAKRAGKSKIDIANDFAYPQNVRFRIDKANRYLNRFDAVKIDKSLDRLVKTDKMLKTYGADVREILEQTTVELAAILWGD